MCKRGQTDREAGRQAGRCTVRPSSVSGQSKLEVDHQLLKRPAGLWR